MLVSSASCLLGKTGPIGLGAQGLTGLVGSSGKGLPPVNFNFSPSVLSGEVTLFADSMFPVDGLNIILAIMILILLFRPQGIFGTKERIS